MAIFILKEILALKHGDKAKGKYRPAVREGILSVLTNVATILKDSPSQGENNTLLQKINSEEGEHESLLNLANAVKSLPLSWIY